MRRKGRKKIMGWPTRRPPVRRRLRALDRLTDEDLRDVLRVIETWHTAPPFSFEWVGEEPPGRGGVAPILRGHPLNVNRAVRRRLIFQVRRLLAYREQRAAMKARGAAIREARSIGAEWDPDWMDSDRRRQREQQRREAERQAKKEHPKRPLAKLLPGFPARITLMRWSVDYTRHRVSGAKLTREIMRIHRQIQSARKSHRSSVTRTR
jgi:hypothetical protein